jgi:N-acetylneuraminate lyase
MKKHLTGLLPAAHTPMHADGRIHLDAIQKQAQVFIEAGLSGAFVCGTTGEGYSLTVAERMEIAEKWQTFARNDFAVIVNVSCLCLDDCKALAAHAQKIGAYAIAVMAPSFYKPASADDLARFCAEVALEAPDLPFYYYHLPSFTGVNILAFDFLSTAAERIPTLAGMKFTHEDLMDFNRCLKFKAGTFDILYGHEQMLLSALALGAKGGIGSTYNFAAPIYLRILKAYESGDMVAARADQARVVEMFAVLERFGVLPAGKAIMKMIGLDCGPSRLPQRPPSDDECDQLRAELERIGFFEYCLRF